jgi:hypothetical protein
MRRLWLAARALMGGKQHRVEEVASKQLVQAAPCTESEGKSRTSSSLHSSDDADDTRDRDATAKSRVHIPDEVFQMLQPFKGGPWENVDAWIRDVRWISTAYNLCEQEVIAVIRIFTRDAARLALMNVPLEVASEKLLSILQSQFTRIQYLSTCIC